MMQVVGFVFALVLVYVLKAVVITRTRDDLLADSVSFSWASARPEDALAAQTALEETEQAPLAAGSMARVGHVGA